MTRSSHGSIIIYNLLGSLLVFIQLLGLVDPSFLIFGFIYFAMWLVAVIYNLDDQNKIRAYLTSYPAYLVIFDFALFGCVVGYRLADQYLELFSPLLTFLAVLTIEGPILIFTLRNLQVEETRKYLLVFMSAFLALGYLVLLMGLMPYKYLLGIRVAAVAVVSAVLALDLLLSFALALLYRSDK